MISFDSCACFLRNCKHFKGVKQDNEDEATERFHCSAFEDEIPADIIEGKNPHLKPTKEQENEIVFEKS